MRLNYVLLATFVCAGLFGLGFLLLPNQMAVLYGVQTDAVGIWLARYFGLTMVGIAAVAWALRGVQEARQQQQIALSYLLYEVLGLLVSLWFVLSPYRHADDLAHRRNLRHSGVRLPLGAAGGGPESGACAADGACGALARRCAPAADGIGGRTTGERPLAHYARGAVRVRDKLTSC